MGVAEAEPFFEAMDLRLTELADKQEWPRYRKVTPIRARQVPTDFRVRTITGQVVDAVAGDYIVVGDDGDAWPCDRAQFEKTHEPLDDDPRNGLPMKDESVWPLAIVLTLTTLVLLVGVIIMIGATG